MWYPNNNTLIQFCEEIHKQLWRWQRFWLFSPLGLCSKGVTARVQYIIYLCMSLSGQNLALCNFSMNIYWMNEGMSVNVKTIYCQGKYKGTFTRKAFEPFLWHLGYYLVGHEVANEDNGNNLVWGRFLRCKRITELEMNKLYSSNILITNSTNF